MNDLCRDYYLHGKPCGPHPSGDPLACACGCESDDIFCPPPTELPKCAALVDALRRLSVLLKPGRRLDALKARLRSKWIVTHDAIFLSPEESRILKKSYVFEGVPVISRLMPLPKEHKIKKDGPRPPRLTRKQWRASNRAADKGLGTLGQQ